MTPCLQANWKQFRQSSWLQFSKGSVATSYIPYGAESVIVSGKNLISPSVFADYELQEDGSYYAPQQKASNYYPFELPAGTYTLSYQCKADANTGYRIFLEDENGNRYDKFMTHTGDFVSFVFTFTAFLSDFTSEFPNAHLS